MAFFGKAQSMVETALAERAAPASRKLTPLIDCDVMEAEPLAEYRRMADSVGVEPSELLIEEFRLFLAMKDIPTFKLSEVVTYMDEITARDNPSKLGWHWCPVRVKDRFAQTFGRNSVEDQSGLFNTGQLGNGWIEHGIHPSMQADIRQIRAVELAHMHQAAMMQSLQANPGQTRRHPGSDFYAGMSAEPYTRTIPMHALSKIALIEGEFGAGKVSFLASEYTTQPHMVIKPDPFLMAVIPNPGVNRGEGRFVIDVWDEPGFGIERMLK